MRRRTLGLALCATGGALLLYAGTTYGAGALARDRARSEWERVEARRAVAATAAALDHRSREAPPVRGAPVARLVIPRLGIDEIVVEGVGDAELNAGPGHVPGSALPGERGNAVISAHRDRHFHEMAGVAAGDTIITETEDARVVWVVRGRRVVERGAPALFASDTPTLTLTTCWPVRYIGPAPERLLVTAVPVGTTANY